MEWKGRRQSENVEDQRGASPGGGNPFGRSGGFRMPGGGGGMRRAGGGMSFGTIIFLVILYFILKAMGIDMLQVLEGGGQMQLPGFEQGLGPVLTGLGEAAADETSRGHWSRHGFKRRQDRLPGGPFLLRGGGRELSGPFHN